MDPDTPRRTVALLQSEHDPAVLEALIQRHRLKVVYTVHTDAFAALAALIVVQHVLEHLADAVVIPHLDTLEAGTPWLVITEAAALITGTHVYPMGSAIVAPVGQER